MPGRSEKILGGNRTRWLGALEAGLLEGFLPYEWRHAIHQQSEGIFPGEKYDPHPDMDWEFELDYRQHPWHRAVAYGFQGILVVGVGYLILRTGRVLGRLKSVYPPS